MHTVDLSNVNIIETLDLWIHFIEWLMTGIYTNCGSAKLRSVRNCWLEDHLGGGKTLFSCSAPTPDTPITGPAYSMANFAESIQNAAEVARQISNARRLERYPWEGCMTEERQNGHTQSDFWVFGDRVITKWPLNWSHSYVFRLELQSPLPVCG